MSQPPLRFSAKYKQWMKWANICRCNNVNEWIWEWINEHIK
jgi:hypothetical protein